MSKSKNIFITGGNRGIGLALVEKMIQRFKPDNLFATFRDASSSQKLEALAAKNPCLHLIQMDVRDDELKLKQVAQLVDEKTNGAGLNLLINNSGINGHRDGLQGVTKEEMMNIYEVNTAGPLMITKAFLPLLEKASSANLSTRPGIGRAAIVNMSSILGSISNTGNGYYSYRGSKAALNICTVAMSVDFAKSKIISVVLHPGWVQTDMGGSSAAITTTESVDGLINVIEDLDESKTGKFIQWNGVELAW